jgi:hypothetical protein
MLNQLTCFITRSYTVSIDTNCVIKQKGEAEFYVGFITIS